MYFKNQTGNRSVDIT